MAGLGRSDDAPRGGRRERHKAETRAALSDAATALIAERGWDVVTVADIAAAADVAPRTFYRYFADKEDAVLVGLGDFFEGYLLLVADRPADEPPMHSLRVALDVVSDFYRTDGDTMATRLMAGFGLVETVPAIAARQHWIAMEAQDRLTELFADRLGVPPTSVEPRMFAAAATAAYHVATMTWAGLPPRRRTVPLVFELAREVLEAYAAGLDRMVVPGIRSIARP